ncbi:succinate dehydrogenase cytochrome b subunit [Nakamurella sp. A5-74]|uniref:Succinate dehydrogenase cytochrome b subunit n=1 Tax=Nakamurella sp. A5-74 TaxID=3158264 RepID=A0AAU8DL66_9ACTN
MSKPAGPPKGRRTTVALKLLMAGTGIIFIGYVLLHMYGNLKAISGKESFDTYAEHLRTFGEPILPYSGLLWIIRAVLILSLVGHAYAAFKLWKRAQDARTQRYAVKKAVSSSLSSRWMRWGGVALLLFIVFHILQFTTRTITPGGDAGSPFDRLVNGFSLWWVFLIYLAAMFALAMHLHHGVFSASQTLGWTSSALSRRVARITGWVIALVISVGFTIPPFLILIGVIK